MSSFDKSNSHNDDDDKNETSSTCLEYFPPMGVYETLFRFQDATGSYMGTEPHHRPWAQGFPLTTPLPGGPDIPKTISFEYQDLKYPPASGTNPLLYAIRDYYNHFYNTKIDIDNIAVFAGGRPAIYATLAFLKPGKTILVEETEYTPYYDALQLLKANYKVVQSNVENNFRPNLSTYRNTLDDPNDNAFILRSNPCNPTGVMLRGQELQDMVNFCSEEGNGGIIDEAYEFFHENAESALKYIPDINKTNIFVISAATKGLQAPGLRVGWVVTSKKHAEIFRNFSSIAMGGVSRLSQLMTTQLLELNRVTHARRSVASFYGAQRERYGRILKELGFTLYTGDGGFYHWCKLPGSLTCMEFNDMLFKYHAAILPGTLCDMFRRGEGGPMGTFIRFSFGAIPPDFYDRDVEILRSVLSSKK